MLSPMALNGFILLHASVNSKSSYSVHRLTKIKMSFNIFGIRVVLAFKLRLSIAELLNFTHIMNANLTLIVILIVALCDTRAQGLFMHELICNTSLPFVFEH